MSEKMKSYCSKIICLFALAIFIILYTVVLPSALTVFFVCHVFQLADYWMILFGCLFEIILVCFMIIPLKRHLIVPLWNDYKFKKELICTASKINEPVLDHVERGE
ncbi:MAG: hypothetical protein WC119_00170 [Synergistaceae bacterium]